VNINKHQQQQGQHQHERQLKLQGTPTTSGKPTKAKAPESMETPVAERIIATIGALALSEMQQQ
jgi:hypothetical protein